MSWKESVLEDNVEVKYPRHITECILASYPLVIRELENTISTLSKSKKKRDIIKLLENYKKRYRIAEEAERMADEIISISNKR